MKKLKFNQIEKNNLTNKEMISLTGGNCCGCSCLKDNKIDWDFYETNGQYNYNDSKYSIKGDIYGAYIPGIVVRP